MDINITVKIVSTLIRIIAKCDTFSSASETIINMLNSTDAFFEASRCSV